MALLSQFLLASGTIASGLRRGYLFFEHCRQLRVVNHVVIGLHRSQADLVALLLLFADSHLGGRRGHLHVVDQLESVEQRDACACVVAVIECGYAIIGVRLRVEVTAILVVSVGLRRNARGEDLHDGLTTLPLLVFPVGCLDSHLGGVADSILHAVVQRQGRNGRLLLCLCRKGERPSQQEGCNHRFTVSLFHFSVLFNSCSL